MNTRTIFTVSALLLCSVSTVAIGQGPWQKIEEVPKGSGVTALRFDEDGRLFIGYVDSKIGILDNGTYIDAIIPQFSTQQLSEFQFAGGDTIYASGATFVLKSVDGGVTWQRAGGVDSLSSPILATRSGIVFGVKQFGQSYQPRRLSHNSGQTWSDIAQGQFDSLSYECIDLAASADGRLLLAGFYGRRRQNLYRSVDSGLTWSAVNLVAANISHLVITKAGTALALTQTDLYDSSELRGINRSTDNGDTWNLVLPLGLDSVVKEPVSGLGNIPISYYPNTGAAIVLWAGVSACYVMRSTDDGLTWFGLPLSGIGPDTLIIAVAAGRDGRIAIATMHDLWELAPAADVGQREAESRMQIASEVRRSQLRLHVTTENTDDIGVRILDVNAKVLKSARSAYTGERERIIEMDLGDMPVGIYFAVVESSSGISIVRLPVVR